MQPMTNAPYGHNPSSAQQARPGYTYGTSPNPPGGQYEFSPPENEVIKSTASWTKQAGQLNIFFVGILPLFYHAATALRGNTASIGQVVAALPAFYVGWTLMKAAKKLSSVVETQGQDVPLLMGGLDGLRHAFKVQVVMLAVAFILGVGISIVISAVKPL